MLSRRRLRTAHSFSRFKQSQYHPDWASVASTSPTPSGGFLCVLRPHAPDQPLERESQPNNTPVHPARTATAGLSAQQTDRLASKRSRKQRTEDRIHTGQQGQLAIIGVLGRGHFSAEGQHASRLPGGTVHARASTHRAGNDCFHLRCQRRIGANGHLIAMRPRPPILWTQHVTLKCIRIAIAGAIVHACVKRGVKPCAIGRAGAATHRNAIGTIEGPTQRAIARAIVATAHVHTRTASGNAHSPLPAGATCSDRAAPRTTC